MRNGHNGPKASLALAPTNHLDNARKIPIENFWVKPPMVPQAPVSSPTTGNPLLSPQDLAKVLGIKLSMIYWKTYKHEWPFFKVGRYLRFDLNEILHLLKRDASK